MQNILFYSFVLAVLGFSSCNYSQNQNKEYDKYFLEEQQSEPQPVYIPSLPEQARDKMVRVRSIARSILAQSLDKRSREIEAIEAKVSSGWLDSVSDCYNLNLKMLQPNIGVALVIIDTAARRYINSQCETTNQFGNENASMLFVAPELSLVEGDTILYIMADWQTFSAKDDKVGALEYLHELMHVLQWLKKPQHIAERNKESFARESEAWQYQIDLWVNSLEPEKRDALSARKRYYIQFPVDSFMSGGIYQDEADFMIKTVGSYQGYWEMFLYYTFGPAYIQRSYKSLQK